MTNWNAVDREFSVEIGVTSEGEKVRVANEFAEADLMVYANVNYVAMDGGYKSYATGFVHYETLAYNHDSSTLKRTNSLFDPPRSALHRSIIRIGKVMQKHTDVFHVETVLDDNRFPWYLSWVQIMWRRMGFFAKAVARLSCFFLKFLPNWLRLWVFWGPLVRGQFGLVQVVAGETEARCTRRRCARTTRTAWWTSTARRTCWCWRRRASGPTPRTPTSTLCW